MKTQKLTRTLKRSVDLGYGIIIRQGATVQVEIIFEENVFQPVWSDDRVVLYWEGLRLERAMWEHGLQEALGL